MGVDALGYAALALAAVLIGFSKTAIGGAATVSIVLFASVLPTRESTGVMLVLLMVGDATAVWTYRRHADWALIRRLMLPVLVGIVVGAVFLGFAPVALLKPVIGGIVVVMTLLQAWRRWEAARDARQVRAAGTAPTTPAASATPVAHPSVARSALASALGSAGFGWMAGFTTMVANAGGPVMTLYLLRRDLEVTRFVGTLAWFFAAVNLTKLPFSIGLGLVRPQRLLLCLALVPAVLLGAVLGRWLISRISKDVFEKVVLVVAGLSCAWLMVS